MLLVDDHLTLGLVAGARVPEMGDEPLATTNLWWWRIATAFRRRSGGRLSEVLVELSALEREALTTTVDDLANLMTIVELQLLLPLAADLAGQHGLNLLAAEALAAALTLEAAIAVAVDTPRLAAAAAATNVSYRRVDG